MNLESILKIVSDYAPRGFFLGGPEGGYWFENPQKHEDLKDTSAHPSKEYGNNMLDGYIKVSCSPERVR